MHVSHNAVSHNAGRISRRGIQYTGMLSNDIAPSLGIFCSNTEEILSYVNIFLILEFFILLALLLYDFIGNCDYAHYFWIFLIYIMHRKLKRMRRLSYQYSWANYYRDVIIETRNFSEIQKRSRQDRTSPNIYAPQSYRSYRKCNVCAKYLQSVKYVLT